MNFTPKHAVARVVRRKPLLASLAFVLAVFVALATVIGINIGTASATPAHDGPPPQVGEVCQPAVPSAQQYRSRTWVPATTHTASRYVKVVPGTPEQLEESHLEASVGKVYAKDGYGHKAGDPVPGLYGPYDVTVSEDHTFLRYGQIYTVGEMFVIHGQKYKYVYVTQPHKVVTQEYIPATPDEELYWPADGSYTTDAPPAGYNLRDTTEVSDDNAHWTDWTDWQDEPISPSETREVEERQKPGTGTPEVVYQDDNPDAPCYIEPELTLVSPEPIVCADGAVVLPQTEGLTYTQEGNVVTAEPLEGFAINSDDLNGYTLDETGHASMTLADDECEVTPTPTPTPEPTPPSPEPSVTPTQAPEPSTPAMPTDEPKKHLPPAEKLASTGSNGAGALITATAAAALILGGLGFITWSRRKAARQS